MDTTLNLVFKLIKHDTISDCRSWNHHNYNHNIVILSVKGGTNIKGTVNPHLFVEKSSICLIFYLYFFIAQKGIGDLQWDEEMKTSLNPEDFGPIIKDTEMNSKCYLSESQDIVQFGIF